MMHVADLLEGTLGLRAPALSVRPLRRVVIDSRAVQPGDVFVALRGERTDGHAFVGDALRRGAAAAIVRRDTPLPVDAPACARVRADHLPLDAAMTQPLLIEVEDPLTALQSLAAFWRIKAAAPCLRVIGVTGSVGKTTTKELIAQVLARRFRVLKSEGNYNNEIGVPLTLLNLRPQHEKLVVEMGMYAQGEIAAYCRWAKPHVGVVTMVAPVHLERLGSIEAIAQAKSELPAALPPAEEGGVAILNDDDARVRAMANITRARVVTYGFTPRADVWADAVESRGLQGVRFTLHAQGRALHVHLPLLGQHSVQTALRAATVALVEGMTPEEIVEALAVPAAEQLRLITVRGPHGSLVIDDTYNASTESVLAALNLLAEINEGPRVAVLGDMLELGDVEQRAHEEVGCRAGIVAQFVIGVGSRARWICQAARACGASAERVFHVQSNAEALAVLQRIVTQRCTILVKGSRGMKMEEIVMGLRAMAESQDAQQGAIA